MSAQTAAPKLGALRKSTMFMFVPATIFIITTMILRYHIIAIGFAPLLISLFVGGYHALCNRRKKPMSPLLAAVIDFAAGLAYLGALLPIWAGRGRMLVQLERRGNIVILATYASSTYLINMAIHFALCLSELYSSGGISWASITGECSRCRDCPRCQRSGDMEEVRGLMVSRKAPVDSRAQYSLLGDEPSPRESGDSERDD